jgi:hypothetical protein
MSDAAIGDEVVIPSSEDPRTKLVFVRGRTAAEETDFVCRYISPAFSGSVRASTFHSGSPAILFADFAENWRGWEGEKAWYDIDDALHLVATSDRLGHVRIAIKMNDHADHVLTGAVVIDAGRLDEWAAAMAHLLPMAR